MKDGVKPGDVIGVNGKARLVYHSTLNGVDFAYIIDPKGRRGPVKQLEAVTVHGGPWRAPVDE